MRFHTTFVGVLMAGLILSGTTGWAVQPQNSPTDDGIRTQIDHWLAERSISGVIVTVSRGDVTVDGTVASAWARNQACEQARKVNGVTRVNCSVTVRRGASDVMIGFEVDGRIRDYAFYTIYDNVEVTVKNGRVTLIGEVMADARARAIGDIAARVPGVVEVNNLLRTIVVSPRDDDIRYEIAGLIYSDPMFGYDRVPGPIHIVVENRRVKLTGTVSSEFERRIAEMLASGVSGVVTVENRLRCLIDE